MPKKPARIPDEILPAPKLKAKHGIVQDADEPIPDKGSKIDFTMTLNFGKKPKALPGAKKRLTKKR